MTQKRLNSKLQRLLDDDIRWYEVKKLGLTIIQTIVVSGNVEFEIARRPANRQTLIEGEDWLDIMGEKATLQNDAWLLISKLNFINEQYKLNSKN